MRARMLFMNTAADSALGKAVAYSTHYDPALLFPIARAGKRGELGIGSELPFHGFDVWNAYELGWLDARGKPRVALAEFRVPADSPNLIESKSFKLYLGSLAQHRLDGSDALRALLAHDLSHAAGSAVSVVLTPVTSHAVRIEPLLAPTLRCSLVRLSRSARQRRPAGHKILEREQHQQRGVRHRGERAL